MDDIMVSICCSVYNHEKYLRQCLDGFMMQKTTFKFEVLIHDDASTDGSADIIREYEKKYPDIIKPIYQTENQYSKGVKISWVYQYPRAKGKYIALCEGDDYWTDEYKLQKQFDTLEQHVDCVFCSHSVRCILEDGKLKNHVYPDKKDINEIVGFAVVEPATCINLALCGHNFATCSYFIKADIITKKCNMLPKFIEDARIGDIPLVLLSAVSGKCIFINDEMSYYRCNSIGSWSSIQRKNPQNAIRNWKWWSEMLLDFDEYSNYQYTSNIQYALLLTEFNLYVKLNNYKKCFQKKYRPIFKEIPFKLKAAYTVYAIFPWLQPIYQHVKQRIKHE